MGLLSLFGIKSKKEKVAEFVEKGALIIDVRTPQEFQMGHIKESKNIPLDKISSSVKKIQKTGKPVITVCRSGARSAQAAAILRANGIEVMNGGAWNYLQVLLR
jgi:rhodanese-related sulfurtransferase